MGFTSQTQILRTAMITYDAEPVSRPLAKIIGENFDFGTAGREIYNMDFIISRQKCIISRQNLTSSG